VVGRGGRKNRFDQAQAVVVGKRRDPPTEFTNLRPGHSNVTPRPMLGGRSNARAPIAVLDELAKTATGPRFQRASKLREGRRLARQF